MAAPTVSVPRLRRLIGGFRRAKILVVGDVMLDEFVWGRVSRISPEAPVPVVWVQSESVMPGGAANVASNLRALGAQVDSVGVIGTDRGGAALLEELRKRGIGTAGLMRDPRLPTTVKTRVIAHHQQVVRVDREQNAPQDASVIERVIGFIRGRLNEVDAVVIEDYGKGVVTRRLLETIIPLVRARRKIITVDPKEEHFDLYREVTAITPNRAEAAAMVGRELDTEEKVRAAAEELLRRLRCEAVVITLGEDGMCVMERRGRCTRIPTVAQEVFDVAGAGDTVIATLTLALSGGASMPEAAVLANYAAGIVVGKVGVAAATPKEVLARLDGVPAKNAVRPTRRSKRT